MIHNSLYQLRAKSRSIAISYDILYLLLVFILSLVLSLQPLQVFAYIDRGFLQKNTINMYTGNSSNSCAQPTTTGECGEAFNIASFNILHTGNDAFESKWRERLPKSLKTLKDNQVQVAGLQEVRPEQHNLLVEIEGKASGDIVYDRWPTKTRHPGFSPNIVIWNKNKFTFVSGEQRNLKYDNGEDTDHLIIVKLRDSGGNMFYVASIHDPANVRPGSTALNKQSRIDNANNYKKIFSELSSEKTPLFLTGDFNSDSDGYCILSGGESIQNVYDAVNNINGKCKSKNKVGIDHIYMPKGQAVTATEYKAIQSEKSGKSKNGSDHPTIIATISLTGNCKSSQGDSNNLPGEDNQERAFYYFRTGDRNFSDIGAAGIVGNMIHESGVDPLNVQNNTSSSRKYGERTANPKGITAGWGLIQWTPADPKVFNTYKDSGASGDISSLGAQLHMVWGNMQGKPPITSGKFNPNEYRKITDLNKAMLYFERHIEGAGVKAFSSRLKGANDLIEKFGGKTPTSMGVDEALTVSCNDSSSSSIDQDIGTGEGSFTDTGEVKNLQTILSNAKKVNQEYKGSLEGDGWCLAISARVWMGSNTGSGYNRAIDVWEANKDSIGHPNKKIKKGALVFYKRNHVAIYLGNNKVLNDGFIRNANFLEGKGWNLDYQGWIDPNDMGWKSKQINNASSTRGWSGF